MMARPRAAGTRHEPRAFTPCSERLAPPPRKWLAPTSFPSGSLIGRSVVPSSDFPYVRPSRFPEEDRHCRGSDCRKWCAPDRRSRHERADHAGPAARVRSAADGSGHERAPHGGAQCREAGRRDVRRCAHRAVSRQPDLHARAADHQRRRPGLDGMRCSRARRRDLGILGDADADEGRRCGGGEGGGGHREGEPGREGQGGAARAGAVVLPTRRGRRRTRSTRSRSPWKTRRRFSSRRTPRR